MASKETMSADAARWFIVGGFQAGATESQLVRISGLPHHAVRRIIINFQQTGLPSKPKAVAQPANQISTVEQDSEGNLLDSDDELQDEEEENKIAPQESISRLSRIRLHRNKQPKASALVAYVLRKAHRPSSKDKQENNHKSWRLPTPPRDQGSPSISPDKASSSSFLPPSPLLGGIDGNSSRISLRWTRKEDKILLNHVLRRLHGGRWQELAAKLEGRHSSNACAERWAFLKPVLFKAISKAGTYGW